MTLTLRFVNSGYNFATFASSVVHTGVKSAGCENRIPQLKVITQVDALCR